MATLKATKLQAAIRKAKKVGLVEEFVTITGCPITLTNLQPEQFEQIVDECEELEDVAYYHAYQIGHISRSLVEVNGIDLRDVDFVEVEVQEPDDSGQLVPKTVQIERHEWVKKEILSTWGREALAIAWRKFMDVLHKAELASKEGVTFDLAQETPEEKYRRLLDEAREIEENLPPDLVPRILEEKGYLLKASKEELEAAGERIDRLAQEQEESSPSSEPPPPSPEPPVPPPVPPPVALASPTQGSPQEVPKQPLDAPEGPSQDVKQRMSSRTPLNRQGVQAPIPVQRRVVSAQQSVPVPPNIAAAAMSASDKAEIERKALEELDPSLAQADPSQSAKRPSAGEIAELRKQGTLDARALVGITDTPPPAGINPRYRKPPGL